MKINPAVVFTFILLSLMVGAGFVSASWGYALGTTALTGVRQPEARPASSLVNAGEGTAPRDSVVILDETEIINTVRARIEGNLSDPSQIGNP